MLPNAFLRVRKIKSKAREICVFTNQSFASKAFLASKSSIRLDFNYFLPFDIYLLPYFLQLKNPNRLIPLIPEE